MKRFPLPITQNPLKNRSDAALSLLQILEPLTGLLCMDGTGLHVGNHSAQYAPRIALFEGWSRLLWGVGPLVAGGFDWRGFPLHAAGFKNGPNPASPSYWGDIHATDQRMVELAAMALSLMLAPDRFWDPLSPEEKKRLSSWMLSVNGQEMPENNWRFFRVLVNLAFEKLGVRFSREQTEADLDFIDSLYVDDGWYRDSVPFDMYNPFAIHFYCLVYYAYKKDSDRERCARYAERAGKFAAQFVHYFYDDGSCVAYGRSLSYRFAVVSFFSACAFAGLEALPWGVMKGIVLRNLRWWFSRPIFDSCGLLTVGYAYPSLLHAEQYNSPTSPYWALKAYLILALPDSHPFWRAAEEPLPAGENTTLLRVPGAIFCRTDTDKVMLSAGQYPGFEANNAAAKYSKFAYSATHGFSVSVGGWSLEKTGCDSMLMLCERGDGYWRERRHVFDVSCGENCLRSRWKPWNDVTITTWLIPCGNWHIRVHHINSARELDCAEGGFAVKLYDGHELEPEIKKYALPLPDPAENGVGVNTSQDSGGIVIELPWGMTAIRCLCGNREASGIQCAPNTNLLFSTTLIPILCGGISRGESVLACLTGAGDASMAQEPPCVRLDFENRVCVADGKTVILH